MKNKAYAVETTFTYPGKWFVYAENEECAKTLAKEKCRKYWSRACIILPRNKRNDAFTLIGWEFPGFYSPEDANVIGESRLSKTTLPVMQSANTVKGKLCYEVDATYIRSGTFYVLAADEDDARKMVEKYCRQRYPRYRSELPLDEVAWEFPRKNIQKTIWEVRLGKMSN